MKMLAVLVVLSSVLSGAAAAGAVSMPRIALANKPNIPVEIVPVEDANVNLLPHALVNLGERLPEGSFVVINRSNKPITALVAVWSYTDIKGDWQQRRINCDGYMTQEPVVKANDLSLITPVSYTPQDQIPGIEASGMLDSPFEFGRDNLIKSDHALPIHLYIDSIVFENGQVWGPDKFRYYIEIQDRGKAITEMVREIDLA